MVPGILKLAQELARHKNIQVTQRYAQLSDDELDKGYYEIFEKKNENLAKYFDGSPSIAAIIPVYGVLQAWVGDRG